MDVKDGPQKVLIKAELMHLHLKLPCVSWTERKSNA